MIPSWILVLSIIHPTFNLLSEKVNMRRVLTLLANIPV